MFCAKCGKQIPDGASFCQACGKPVNIAGLSQPMYQAKQSMPQVVGRPTAPLPIEQPVRCPACGMLAYSGQSHCLICDADLSTAVTSEQRCEQESQQT